MAGSPACFIFRGIKEEEIKEECNIAAEIPDKRKRIGQVVGG